MEALPGSKRIAATMKTGKFAIVFSAIVFSVPMIGEDELQFAPPSKEDFHLFLLAGQSNMAGRGTVEEEDGIVHPRVFALDKDGNWKPAIDPIHYDKTVAGVGLGISFAIALAERDTSISIGLIPAACGGSPISSWEPGGYHEQTKSHPYDDAIKRARRAMKDGLLKGILWHQGESDSKPKLAAAYQGKMEDLIKRIRADLDIKSAPFLIGQLGRFSENPWSDSRKRVNEAHIRTAKQMPLVGFVSSEGLTCKSDLIHFDRRSLRLLGQRYAEVYLSIPK